MRLPDAKEVRFASAPNTVGKVKTWLSVVMVLAAVTAILFILRLIAFDAACAILASFVCIPLTTAYTDNYEEKWASKYGAFVFIVCLAGLVVNVFYSVTYTIYLYQCFTQSSGSLTCFSAENVISWIALIIVSYVFTMFVPSLAKTITVTKETEYSLNYRLHKTAEDLSTRMKTEGSNVRLAWVSANGVGQ